MEEINIELASKEWWRNKRLKYNLGLIVAGFFAFICYAILGTKLIMPYDENFEITLFTIAFQGTGYLIMMVVANLFYNLGYWADKNYNKRNSGLFRHRLFNLGFWFSFALPFLIPLVIIIEYFIEFKTHS